MKKNVNMEKMLNLIRQGASEDYKKVVPMFKNASDNDLANSMNPLFTNELLYNTFYTGFTNMIATTVFKTIDTFDNPLSVLKKGDAEFGADIREIANDLLNEHKYTLNDNLLADVLKLDEVETYQCIHRLNRKVYFKVSVTESELELAFTSWAELEKLFVNKVELLYNSNYVREYEWCKQLLRMSVQDGKVFTEEVSEVVDETTGKAFVKSIKKTVGKFKNPNTIYTPLYKITSGVKKLTTWTKPENTVFVTSTDTMAELDTDVLAVAFNVDKLKFNTDITLEVDDIGYYRVEQPSEEGEVTYKYYHIDGMVFDRHFPQIYDKKVSYWAMPIASAMIEQRYLHVWQTFSVSPFCNAKAFVHEVEESEIPTGYEFDFDFESTNDTTPTTVSVEI